MKYLIQSTRSKLSAISLALMASLFSAAAFAQTTTVGQTAATAIDASKSQVELVQTAMLGVLIVLVVFGLIRKSFSK